MKRAVVIGTVAGIVFGAGSAYGWREWTHSPTYSLKQVASAVEHRDRYELEKYVDIDSVLQSALADATDGNPLASALGGAVLTQLKPQIIKAIEDGSVPTDSRFGKGVQKTLGGQLPQIDRQGRNAYFAIDLTTKGGAPFALRIHMTQVPDGYWRIDRIANMKELRALEEQEEAARKAAIAKANEERLSKLVVAAKLHTSVREGWARKNRFQVRFENTSDRSPVRDPHVVLDLGRRHRQNRDDPVERLDREPLLQPFPEALLPFDLGGTLETRRYDEATDVPALGHLEMDFRRVEPRCLERLLHFFFHWNVPLLTTVVAFSRAIRAFSFSVSPWTPRSS